MGRTSPAMFALKVAFLIGGATSLQLPADPSDDVQFKEGPDSDAFVELSFGKEPKNEADKDPKQLAAVEELQAQAETLRATKTIQDAKQIKDAVAKLKAHSKLAEATQKAASNLELSKERLAASLKVEERAQKAAQEAKDRVKEKAADLEKVSNAIKQVGDTADASYNEAEAVEAGALVETSSGEAPQDLKKAEAVADLQAKVEAAKVAKEAQDAKDIKVAVGKLKAESALAEAKQASADMLAISKERLAAQAMAEDRAQREATEAQKRVNEKAAALDKVSKDIQQADAKAETATAAVQEGQAVDCDPALVETQSGEEPKGDVKDLKTMEAIADMQAQAETLQSKKTIEDAKKVKDVIGKLKQNSALAQATQQAADMLALSKERLAAQVKVEERTQKEVVEAQKRVKEKAQDLEKLNKDIKQVDVAADSAYNQAAADTDTGCDVPASPPANGALLQKDVKSMPEAGQRALSELEKTAREKAKAAEDEDIRIQMDLQNALDRAIQARKSFTTMVRAWIVHLGVLLVGMGVVVLTVLANAEVIANSLAYRTRGTGQASTAASAMASSDEVLAARR